MNLLVSTALVDIQYIFKCDHERVCFAANLRYVITIDASLLSRQQRGKGWRGKFESDGGAKQRRNREKVSVQTHKHS